MHVFDYDFGTAYVHVPGQPRFLGRCSSRSFNDALCALELWKKGWDVRKYAGACQGRLSYLLKGRRNTCHWIRKARDGHSMIRTQPSDNIHCMLFHSSPEAYLAHRIPLIEQMPCPTFAPSTASPRPESDCHSIPRSQCPSS